jgi:dsRNA-specific ribonuclease
MTRIIATNTAMLAVVASLGFAGAAGASTVTKPMPEKQWRATVNNICVQSDKLGADAADAAFAAVPKDGQPSIEQMAAYVKALAPIIQQRIDAIDALKEPTRLKAKVKRLLKTAQGELDTLVADPNRGFEGNPFSSTILAADKLKLKECGS